MAKALVFSALTANSQIKATNGYLQVVNITASGDSTAVVTIYDNPSAASGTVLFSAKGTVTGSFLQALGTGSPGVPASTGLSIAITGATSPIVQVIYE